MDKDAQSDPQNRLVREPTHISFDYHTCVHACPHGLKTLKIKIKQLRLVLAILVGGVWKLALNS